MAAGLDSSGYDVLARHYDALMKDVPYARWVDFITEFALKMKKPDIRVVDAGCGTGTVSLALGQRGFKVIGIDQSAEMLALARFKSDQQKVPITWARTNFSEVKIPCDLFISTCDGVNHLLSVRELVRFFSHAYKCLVNGGYFIFDINSEYKFCNILAGSTFYWQIPGLDVIWVNNYSSPVNSARITLFEYSGHGNYVKSTMEIRECCYKVPSLIYYLSRIGFRDISLWNNYKSRLTHDNVCRITVAAKK